MRDYPAEECDSLYYYKQAQLYTAYVPGSVCLLRRVTSHGRPIWRRCVRYVRSGRRIAPSKRWRRNISSTSSGKTPREFHDSIYDEDDGIHGPGQVEVREIPMPEPGDRQVLVQVKACAICTWEQRFYRGSRVEDYPFRGGHEASGVIVAKGRGAQCDAGVGDPVCLEIMVRCGQCYYCRRAWITCASTTGGALPGQPWGPGGMSDYVLVEDYMIYRGMRRS